MIVGMVPVQTVWFAVRILFPMPDETVTETGADVWLQVPETTFLLYQIVPTETEGTRLADVVGFGENGPPLVEAVSHE